MVGSALAIGAVNGLFGGGGGMLCVPLLQKVLHLETKKAHATAILLILPITIGSAIAYGLNGYFEFSPITFISIGVLVGGVAGALLLKILPEQIVGIVFAILMIIAGVKLALFY